MKKLLVLGCLLLTMSLQAQTILNCESLELKFEDNQVFGEVYEYQRRRIPDLVLAFQGEGTYPNFGTNHYLLKSGEEAVELTISVYEIPGTCGRGLCRVPVPSIKVTNASVKFKDSETLYECF